ncbi:uncharacterized protein LOC106693988 [Microplitis demolitor]|uniref:uncharacterized protein LOC106693988 n=1 Tax=Microplitis demolitor TaxID=69319 RepID=UPI0006D4F720|nr:uncharacterized protein LOC106693988 [Microplitis demolitor]XP_014299196.1 uncharacterized protein LOC106693988 [Microplitis demolitor]XP_014299197.1 uncharacterized protein LOC106693988 [Microplitis demolitor]XP_014299198.1 uncharacterized protein LOC106693988 [Microplitis demolitor]
MAEEPSPYLSAIQQVAGSTPSDKFHTLNIIAKRISKSENQNDSMQSAVNSSELPKALKPLVQVEVARLSGQFEGICEALKSDDSVVVDRALRAKWFFNGSHENCRVQYYQAEIFPVVSLQSRLKIIKALANNLTAKPAIAEEFYTAVTLMYGEKQAHPLLMACSQSFIWNCITEHKVRLNNRLVRIFFDKYPELVVNYLKLSKKSDDEFERNIRPVNLQSHASFLPRLIKKYPETFIELIEMHNNNFNIKLSRTCTDLFFKKFPNSLMRNPRLFLPMLDLKVVHKNLTDLQFKAIFKHQFPPELDSFEFDELLRYLEFFPEDDKLPLMISTFEEVYGVKFLDCSDKITHPTLLLLSCEDRTKFVAEKFQTMEDRSFLFSDTPWICYLPCDESIKRLEFIIKHTWSSTLRQELIKQLIFTCHINADNDSFLRVIKYISAKHKNEPLALLLDIFEYILRRYPLDTLAGQHWEALIDLIISTDEKHAVLHEKISPGLIIAAIRYDLGSNINENTDKMKLLTKLYLSQRFTDWRIFKDNLRYDRICLDHFISNVLETNSVDIKEIANPLIDLISSIKNFNDAVTEAKSDVRVIRMEEYPELVQNVQSFIDGHIGSRAFTRILKVMVKNLDEKVYNALVSERVRKTEKLPQIVIDDLKSKHTWRMLKTDPQCFDHSWEKILKECVKKIHKFCSNCKSCSERDPLAKKFLRMSRWCQDVPMKFVERLLRNIKWHQNGRDLITLAYLLEGPELERIIATFNRTTVTKTPDKKKGQLGLKLDNCVPIALSLANPPGSLDLILKYGIGKCEDLAIRCLINVSRRTRVEEVILFAMDLLGPSPMSKLVFIRTLGIRLLCMIVDAQGLHFILTTLWKYETDLKTRALVFKNVVKLFESFPNDQNWKLINECIDGLKPSDKYTFKFLMKFDAISNELIAEYVCKLFNLFRRLGDEENGLQPDVVWFYITKLLNIDKNILVLFSDELHNGIIEKYVLDLSLPKTVLSAGHSYLINYILTARDKLEDRLNRFGNIFIKIVNENWDVPHPTEPSFYPANYFVHELINNIVRSLPNNPIKPKLAFTAIMAAFGSNLRVHQDPEFYSSFTVASIVNDKVSPKELVTNINRLLPAFVKSVDIDFIETVAKYLYEIIDSVIGDPGYQLEVVMSLDALENYYASVLAFHLVYFRIQVKNDQLTKVASPHNININHLIMSQFHDLLQTLIKKSKQCKYVS